MGRPEKKYTFENGETYTVSELVNLTKMPKYVIKERIRVHWTLKKILSTPYTGYTENHIVRYKGKPMTDQDFYRLTKVENLLSKFRKKHYSMVFRCTNKRAKGYCHYGGRGIKVCHEWMEYNNFERDMLDSFVDHVLKHGIKDTTLDRIDIDGDYCLENCRWATIKEQQRNRKLTKKVMLHGKEVCLGELAEQYQIPYDTLHARIFRYRLPVEEAIDSKDRRREQ